MTKIKLEHILYTEGNGGNIPNQVQNYFNKPTHYYFYNTNNPNAFIYYQNHNDEPINNNFSPSYSFPTNNNNQFSPSNTQSEPNPIEIFSSGNFPSSTSFEQKPQQLPLLPQKRPQQQPQTPSPPQPRPQQKPQITEPPIMPPIQPSRPPQSSLPQSLLEYVKSLL